MGFLAFIEPAPLLVQPPVPGGGFAPSDVVANLSVSDQQLTAIAKALTTDARVIIMDEPSATLTDHDLAEMFRVIRELTAAGKSVIYISHRLDEVKEIGDRATVMRDGATVGAFDVAAAVPHSWRPCSATGVPRST